METLLAIAEHLKYEDPLRAGVIGICHESGSCTTVAQARHKCPTIEIQHADARLVTSCGELRAPQRITVYIREWLDGFHVKAV